MKKPYPIFAAILLLGTLAACAAPPAAPPTPSPEPGCEEEERFDSIVISHVISNGEDYLALTGRSGGIPAAASARDIMKAAAPDSGIPGVESPSAIAQKLAGGPALSSPGPAGISPLAGGPPALPDGDAGPAVDAVVPGPSDILYIADALEKAGDTVSPKAGSR